MTVPLVSIVLPCRNESRYIERCLVSLQASTYPADRVELIVVDGMSDDGTRPLLIRAAAHDPRITLLDNPKLSAPAAMNLGIARASGQVVLRADAHAEYPPEYIEKLASALDEYGADNVGGVWKMIPGADTTVAQAIALALSHPIAVGNAYYRIGTKAPRWVDTVPFGCWKRETFARIGLFDESLARNQDDELNMRLRRIGGRILLLPSVVIDYFARETLIKLGRMYWQYGYYKPLTAVRAQGRLRPRQFAPAAFVVSIAVLSIGALASGTARQALVLVLGAYLVLILSASVTAARMFGFGVWIAFLATFPTIHFSYGLGFLKGVLHFVILKRAPDSATPAITR